MVLAENAWDEQRNIASVAWWIIEQKGEVSLFASHMQAWSDEEYRQSLQVLGLGHMNRVSTNDWPTGEAFAGKLYVLHGVKQPYHPRN